MICVDSLQIKEMINGKSPSISYFDKASSHLKLVDDGEDAESSLVKMPLKETN